MDDPIDDPAPPHLTKNLITEFGSPGSLISFPAIHYCWEVNIGQVRFVPVQRANHVSAFDTVTNALPVPVLTREEKQVVQNVCSPLLIPERVFAGELIGHPIT